jgi:hypothetical protein
VGFLLLLLLLLFVEDCQSTYLMKLKKEKKTLVVRLLVASSPNLQACKSKMLLSYADFGGTTCCTRKLVKNNF